MLLNFSYNSANLWLFITCIFMIKLNLFLLAKKEVLLGLDKVNFNLQLQDGAHWPLR